MSNRSIVVAVAVIGGFVSLMTANLTQGERNAAAQAELAKVSPIPEFSKMINAQAAAATAPPAGISLRSVSVEFPASDRALPAGPNVDIVTNNCTACHSPGMILTQPQLTAATWTAEVNKMRSTYKAPVADEDVPQIVAYLAAMPVGR